jgi:hypothetical protein
MTHIKVEADIGEMVMEQVKDQGVGVVQVSDGHVLVFTTAILEKLLARSIEGEGKVMVFVKHQPKA